MLLGNLTHDRQAQTAALLSARGRAAEEAVEHVRQVLRRYPWAVVAHADSLGVDHDLNRPALRGVPRRIVEQVVDGAPKPLRHAIDEHRLELRDELHARRVAPGPR